MQDVARRKTVVGTGVRIAVRGNSEGLQGATDEEHVLGRPFPLNAAQAVAPPRDADLKSLVVPGAHDAPRVSLLLREVVLALRLTTTRRARPRQRYVSLLHLAMKVVLDAREDELRIHVVRLREARGVRSCIFL